MRIFTLVLITILCTLQYDLFFGKNGIIDYNAVHSDIAVQQEVNNSLKKRNDLMFAEIDDLRQGLDAIEERARHELGMIKNGETFYRIIGDDNEANSTFNSDDE
ncbi:cell division protein FtsB [Vibrio rumoiensis]|uniref:Cell division protein FtsB n=1 Tax=Vibrio rumoiensis 1S-45 TaxID=1188252 RepID=A0A1E5E4V9_9VIBR|nr:cell division protein FtsB [Vibrio rumoiensis]OEF27809.1 cell division protein FtsB [Vibrio rumoiensis 1S-45]